jgi:hypothetical protein
LDHARYRYRCEGGGQERGRATVPGLARNYSKLARHAIADNDDKGSYVGIRACARFSLRSLIRLHQALKLEAPPCPNELFCGDDVPSEFHALCFFELKGGGRGIVFQFVTKLPFLFSDLDRPSPSGRSILFIRRLSVWFFGTNRREKRAVKRITPAPQQGWVELTGSERMFLTR